MSEQRPLHRLFGLTWLDFFRGTNIEVETEIDLSQKQQFIDVVIIRKDSGPIPKKTPDGFEDLAAHNLITFKSHQEALDGWSLIELGGHYVNYRKQFSPSMQDLLPETDFRLYAVCARYPSNLAQQVVLTPLREGVDEVPLITMQIRIVVINQLPQEEQNAMLHLFSVREELLRYAKEHYRPHSPETSTLLYQLYKAYNEDSDMPDKLKDFVRQSIDELLASLPPEERLKGMSPEERLKGLPAEERLKGMSPGERLKGLPAEELLKRLFSEDFTRALSPEMREAAIPRQLKPNGSSSKPE